MQFLIVRVLRIKGHICIPRRCDLTRLIMAEDYSSRYSIQTKATKIYCDLKQYYWWCFLKRDIMFKLSVKYEHQKSGGVTQRMPIQEWMWECIEMDFVVGLPHTLEV